MFDLERELKNWRRPFLVSHLYSENDIRELESHFRDAIDDEIGNGGLEPEAFWMALSKVGDESVLRNHYKKSWSEINSLKKYWKLLQAESKAFSGVKKRAAYSIGRIVSLVVGTATSVFLFAFAFFMARGINIWDLGSPVYEQGAFITLIFGLMSIFSWFPFKRWRNKLGDWVRLVYVIVISSICWILLLYSSIAYEEPGQVWGMMILSLLCLLSPSLWLAQILNRRQHVVDYEVLLFPTNL